MNGTIKKMVAIATMVATCVGVAAETKYQPEEWNVKARREFANKRFGIFIHWGLYANYAQGEWYIVQGPINEDAYSQMMHGFYPSKFNAREWVKTFKDAGAKYITFTSRHHDSFSMWPSKADDGYNIANSPFKRDIVGELAKACEEEGIQLNLYYSLLDWHRKDYPPGSVSRMAQVSDRKPDFASYKNFMMAQLKELLETYKPGCIWFDGEWDHAENKNGKWVRTLDWGMDELYDLIHSYKVLTANNHHQNVRDKEDIQLYEGELPGEAGCLTKHQTLSLDRPVEKCEVIQDDVWGYRIREKRFRTAEQVVNSLARASAKGVNLLMNVGPDGSGMLPAEVIDVYKGVGAWMRKNSESIYETDGCPLADSWRVVSTRRDNVIYLHFLDVNTTKFTIAKDAFEKGTKVASATYLETGKKASVTKDKNGSTIIAIERAADNKFDVVVKLVLK